MPDFCPCGSGLQLESCCMSEDIARIKQGAVHRNTCPERRNWAESYIHYKTVVNEHIIQEQAYCATSQGREITCRPGCTMCCHEFIAARIEECDAIVMYLYSYPVLMNRFLVNYVEWYDTMTSGDNVLKKASGAYQTLYKTRKPEDKTLCEAYALEFAKKYTPCPFLEDEKCLIYPVRPFVCTTYCMTSDKKYCDPKWHLEARKHKQKIKSAMNPLEFESSYYVDLKGRLVFDSVQTMVYEIIKYGHYKGLSSQTNVLNSAIGWDENK